MYKRQVGAEVYHAEDIYAWNPNYITQAHMKKVGGGYTVLPFDQMPTPWTKAILQQERDVLRPVQQLSLIHISSWIPGAIRS